MEGNRTRPKYQFISLNDIFTKPAFIRNFDKLYHLLVFGYILFIIYIFMINTSQLVLK